MVKRRFLELFVRKPLLIVLAMFFEGLDLIFVDKERICALENTEQ
jgi:hypothetical protein